VIAFRIDHQTLQDRAHFFLDFRLQFGKLARFNKAGDVIVGMKARFARLYPFTDALRDWDIDRFVSDEVSLDIAVFLSGRLITGTRMVTEFIQACFFAAISAFHCGRQSGINNWHWQEFCHPENERNLAGGERCTNTPARYCRPARR
jgi:hypothetical protein